MGEGLGFAIGLGDQYQDWELGLRIGIGAWEWYWGFGLVIRIGDWVQGLGLGIKIRIGDWDWGMGFGDWDWNEIHISFVDYASAFIRYIWTLCGCWITEKLAPTRSNIIFGLLQYR